jgi:hypothetical protein
MCMYWFLRAQIILRFERTRQGLIHELSAHIFRCVVHTLISAKGFALSQSRVARTFSSKSALADADMCATAAATHAHN